MRSSVLILVSLALTACTALSATTHTQTVLVSPTQLDLIQQIAGIPDCPPGTSALAGAIQVAPQGGAAISWSCR